MASSKWKDYLLKSSLPLELRVAEAMGRSGFWVGGEYPYVRRNEEGRETEFSVDVHAVYELNRGDRQWGQWEVLLECKYATPGVRWVFSPLPQVAEVLIGSIWVTEDLSTHRIIDKTPLLKIDHDLPYCMKGIALHDSGFDPNSVTKGLNQLRYAMPQVVNQGMEGQLSARHDEDLLVLLTTPILVTTADLRILRHDITLNGFHNADNLEDVTTEVDALVAYQPLSPHLKEYASALHFESENDVELGDRVNRLASVLKTKGFEPHLLPSRWHARSSLTMSTERVLVVQFDALESYISRLLEDISAAAESVEHIAIMTYDVWRGGEEISALPAEDA